MDRDFTQAATHWLTALSPASRTQWIADHCLVRLPGNRPPWQCTGLRVAAGQAFSLFATGRIRWSARQPELYSGPRFHLWARVAPGGKIVNLSRDTGSFVADVSGELELGIYMGMWKNETGDLATGPELYDRPQGHLDALLIVWRGAPAAALASLVHKQPHPSFVASELARLAASIAPPEGWRYLIETGQAEIFTEAREADGERIIKLDARDDQGIICKSVDCALTPATRITWRWASHLTAELSCREQCPYP
jgi:hypothetical protein